MTTTTGSPAAQLTRPRSTRPVAHISQQAGNSSRYLYERLSEKRFQQLCSAILTQVFPDVTCFPVGQKDGGRDATLKVDSGSYIFQVKWTNQSQRDPVSWLNAAIRNEHDSISRLVSEGASKYYLLTNVAGTSAAKRGTMDKFDTVLAGHEKTYGIPMRCWWQADLDARIDGAPPELKWTFADMLAGHDAVRYLRDGEPLAAQDRELTTLLRKVVATQWLEDARVKFKQVELDSHDLSTLFVDVEATRTAPPRRAGHLLDAGPGSGSLGGAARYLLTSKQPFTLVRGEPGQGKSTLGQYVCQVHRADLLTDKQLLGAQRPDQTAEIARLPIRVDLRDYATWMGGADPFHDYDPSPKKSKRPTPAALEAFLCHLLAARSGGRPITVPALQDLLERFPTLIVLDGLDEVAQVSVRARIVTEINEFATRLGGALATPQLVVTTRPNASQLPEPSEDIFETISLTRLSSKLRTIYLRRWADAQSIAGRDKRQLEGTFATRSAEPHISQLADNPMQLTILLYLIRRLGDSIPVNRTALYTAYLETFLAREAEKSPLVHNNRTDLEEVTAFLGWHLQSRAEANGDGGRLSAKGIQSAINGYLFAVHKRESDVAELFTVVTDRVWALTSKIEGFFEFDVQPLREYFAARFLSQFVGADQPNFDPSTVLRHLVRRPYWYNTSRFYAGFARPNELSDLVDSLAEEIETTSRASQVRVTAWSLLADGVFRSRAKAEHRAALMFADDLSVVLMNHLLDSDSVVSMPAEHGAQSLSTELRNRAESKPYATINVQRMQLAARILPDRATFDAWWQPRMQAAAGTEHEAAWLRIGTAYTGGTRLPPDTKSALCVATAEAAPSALEAGVSFPEGSAQESNLLNAVLGGTCSDADVGGVGLPADLVRLCAPRHFLAMATEDGRPYAAPVGHSEHLQMPSQRRAILDRLKVRNSSFTAVQAAMRFNKGQGGTTSPWGNTARALSEIFGPCWLAAEIAVIGAASPDKRFLTGGNITPDSDVLGQNTDYGRLLQQVRSNRSKTEWWTQTNATYTDPLSQATWAVAAVSVANEAVLVDVLPLLATSVEVLPAGILNSLLATSSRVGASGLSRRLSLALVESAARVSPAVSLLIAHHAIDPGIFTPLPLEPSDFSSFGTAAWPLSHSATACLLNEASDAALNVLSSVPYNSRVTVGPRAAGLADEQLRHILRKAGTFPAVWVVAADRELSLRGDEAHLSTIASNERWFD